MARFGSGGVVVQPDGVAGALWRALSTGFDSPQHCEFTHIARSISEGDLCSRVKVIGKDELAHIGHALNVAQDQLRDSLQTISEQIRGVTDTVVVLDDQAGASVQAADHQRQQVALIAAAALELANTAQGVALTCETAVSFSSEARNLANEGHQQSSQTTLDMQQMTGRLDEATAALACLRERTQRIEVMVAVIKGIADKTNLLALNASIERAREVNGVAVTLKQGCDALKGNTECLPVDHQIVAR